MKPHSQPDIAPHGQVILPGGTIGVMGGGQLGRMFAIAARRMGYRIHTFAPDEDTPTGQLADVEVCAAYEDEEAVRHFAEQVDVLTFEFENIPLQSVQWAAQHCIVRPSGSILHIAQHRLREKRFLEESAFPVPAFRAVNNHEELTAAAGQLGFPCVLKTAAFGYDGKGQVKLGSLAEADATKLDGAAHVLEAWVSFDKEISVVVARGMDGGTETFPVCENIHRNHILDVTLVPARISGGVAQQAQELAQQIAGKLDLVGLMAIEMFLLADGAILINELAPRPHNSGHFSFDACVTSQFEQQVRGICGLPLGSPELLRPCAMVNLLGELWENGEPDWAAAASLRDVKIHLYGKQHPRPGRKMGHLLAFGTDAASAMATAIDARQRLSAAPA
jgi:5-(carboxyamino)imidazole ribonucleotide synthase